MAVYRRDRSFSKIIDEVEMEAIPVSYIKTIVLNLEDGSMVELKQEDLKKVETLEELLTIGFSDIAIVDMRIELDFDMIEDNVTDKVNRLLNKDHNKEE
jgi:hypothetical protein